MNAPRLEVDLDRISHNARTLVERLAAQRIRVTGVTKAVLGSPAVAAAFTAGGVAGLGDSRVENLAALHAALLPARRTLIRAPMLTQVDQVVRHAHTSLNTEHRTIAALAHAAVRAHTTHDVVLMVELGDLREGVAAVDVLELARAVLAHRGLRLAGLGTNLACQSGVSPDQEKMDELSTLVEQVEAACRTELAVVSGGNSASLEWALGGGHVGRINDLRLGESILLGTEPQYRSPIEGLHQDACRLVAEVIEVQTKPAQPWGNLAQTAFGDGPPRHGTGTIRQAILALGHQDTDPAGLTTPPGMSILGASSDHLVIAPGDHSLVVGDEVTLGLNYSALVRAATSPFVANAFDGVLASNESCSGPV